MHLVVLDEDIIKIRFAQKSQHYSKEALSPCFYPICNKVWLHFVFINDNLNERSLHLQNVVQVELPGGANSTLPRADVASGAGRPASPKAQAYTMESK